MKVMFSSTGLVSPNFKAIMTGKDFNYNYAQQRIAKNIADELRTTKPEFNNMTAEDFYKRNYDLDFLMLPSYSSCDSIDLLGTCFYKNVIGEWCWQNSGNFLIGTYDSQNSEKDHNNILEDVKKAKENIADKAQTNRALGYLALAVIMYGSLLFIGKAQRTAPKPATVIEKADTLIQKTDTIKPDTANFLKL